MSLNPQKIPVSPVLQRLFEELQSMDGARRAARGEAKMLLTILAARKLPVDEPARARILRCTDAATLERWGEAVLAGTTINEMFTT